MQMGKALTIITMQYLREEMAHHSVDAWFAPSECHAVVRKGEEKRARIARRHAKSVSGLSRRQFNLQMKKTLTPGHRRALDRLYDILWAKHVPNY